ncbi:S41 family peptidase, partial [Porphyromonas sp.]
SEDEFFDLMVELMCHLKDGHVNLFAPFDVGGWDIRKGSRYCLDSRIRNLYLQPHVRRAGSIYYTPITYNGHAADSIGYMVIPSFSSSISLTHLHAVFTRLAHCRGLIIDMRNNGGGLLTNADRLASVLIPSDTVVGYMSTKTGPGHQDFGPLKEIRVSRAPISWQRPTVILVDRGTYSAANSLVAYVKGTTRHVLFMGDRTGGGGGLPRSSELPNGWWLRYSSSRMYDAQRHGIEAGIEPHIIQEQTDEATAQQQDALIERAITILLAATK